MKRDFVSKLILKVIIAECLRQGRTPTGKDLSNFLKDCKGVTV